MKLKDKLIAAQLAIWEIQNGIAMHALIISNDTLSLLITRIQTTGVDASGKPFKGYSTAPLPFDYFEERILNKSNFNKAKKDSRDGLISYKDIRSKVEGLNVAFKDFTYSGQLFGQTGVAIILVGSNTYRAIIGGQTPYAVNIYEQLRLTHPPILKLNKAELEYGVIALEKWVNSVLKKHKVIL